MKRKTMTYLLAALAMTGGAAQADGHADFKAKVVALWNTAVLGASVEGVSNTGSAELNRR